jgi:hypothetical protein
MANNIQAFPPIVKKALKHYVYLISDPDTQEIFYVGEGVNNRVFSHLKEKNSSEKSKRIQSLFKRDKMPNIEILSHCLKKEEAIKIEAAVLDALGMDNLTNEKKGFHSTSHGRMTLEQIISKYKLKEAKINEPAVLIKLQKTFRYDMTPNELYDFTRGIWVIAPKNQNGIKYAFSIFDNVVQEVYEVRGWFKAGQTFSVRKGTWNPENRWEFVGNVANDKIRNKYRFKSVKKYFPPGAANPIQYLNLTNRPKKKLE